jgi:NAD(P)-dependent dehydrogenase (short-subunit alcohol dehydrogenase family)
METQGKIAIVTGASSGIGLATAKLLANEGAKAVLVSRSKEKLSALSAGLPGSLAITCDMSRPDDVKGMVAQAGRHFGRVDILVNCAGQGYDSPVEKIDLGTFRRIFELDVVGPLAAMQAVIPLMKGTGGGSIVNISSGTALAHWPNMSPYSSLKSALASISLTAREELKGDGISVSVIYPYVTLTDFEKNTIKNDVPEWDGELPHPPDTPEFVAGKILEAIRGGDAEVFPHGWMRELGK